MAVKLTGANLKKLLQHLNRYDPYSAVISGVVASVNKGDPHGLQVWANKETEPNVVVVSADESKCKNSFCQKLAFVYSTDNNAIDIKDTLLSPGVLNLKFKILFREVLKPTHDVIQSVMSSKKGKVSSVMDNLLMFEVMPGLMIPPCPLPKGFYFGEFTPELADMAARIWIEKGPEVSDYFCGLHKWGYEPTVVYESNGNTPVGWLMQSFHNITINFYVKPEYRRTRMGLSIGCEHIRRLRKRNTRILGIIKRHDKVSVSGITMFRCKKYEDAEFIYSVFEFSN